MEAIEWCHERVHELGVELAKSRDVTVGQKTGKCAAPRAFFDKKRGDLMPPGDRFRVADRRPARHAMRALDDGTVAALHEAHHFHLSLDGKRAVDDTDAAFERDGFRHLRFGDAVHVGRDDRKLEAERVGQLTGERDAFPRVDDPLLGAEEKVAIGLAVETVVEVHLPLESQPGAVDRIAAGNSHAIVLYP